MLTWVAVITLATIHPLEEAGFRELLNLDFARAHEAFERLSRETADSPSGPHYLASLLWLEELTRRGALSGETFQSARYWSRTRPEPPSPSLQKEFSALISESRRRAEARLKKNPANREALYFLGATESVVSGFEATLTRRFFAAYLAGRRARSYHERLIALDPHDADAYLVPGLFEYSVATLPRTTQFLAFLIGARGSKEKGIGYLERAAKDGERARWDAKLLLAVIRERERKFPEALALLGEFEREFPRNPLYPLEHGWAQLLDRDWPGARATFEAVKNKRDRHVPNFDQVHPAVIQMRIGESYLFARRFHEASVAFERALEAPGPPVELRAAIHLRRGQAWDGLQERDRAKENYLETIRLNVDRASVRAAREFLKTPYRPSGG